MAAPRAKAAPVGSAQWVDSEREQAAEFADQEVEEFGYSVRNEMEWLNEHMADIFSKSAVNFADVFKTPGKLRGKTPHTARKRDILEQRQPLTDIFAPNTQSGPTPAKSTAFYDKVTQFKIAEDGENLGEQQRPIRRSRSPQRMGKPGNTDSGYHGMTEDEMEADTQTDADTVPSQSIEMYNAPARESAPQRVNMDENGVISDESFVSAKEGTSTRNASKEKLHEEHDSDNATVPDEDMVDDQPVAADENEAAAATVEEMEVEPEDQDLDAEMSHPPSETSSPEKPIQRKSSFTFSSLPAREPLTAKRSIGGGRSSQIDTYTRNSVLARSLGKSFGAPQIEDSELLDKPAETKAPGKTSTQLLHERITMLGKTKEPRPSKSIPQSVLYPQLPANEMEDEDNLENAPPPPPKDEPTAAPLDDEDDDWIAPTKTAPSKSGQATAPASVQPSPARPALHQKSISTTKLPSPTRDDMSMMSRQQKALSVSHPAFNPEDQSTTPAGSPTSKKFPDAHMSASKKLWTAFKSARSLFASSAGSSAAAKMEAHASSPFVQRSKQPESSDESRPATAMDMPGALNSAFLFPTSPARPVSVLSSSPSRKTRNSTESKKRQEKESKVQKKAADDLEKVREKERQKVAKAQEEASEAERAEQKRLEKEEQARSEQEAAAVAAAEAAEAAEAEAAAEAAAQRPTSAESDSQREDVPPPPPPKSMLPAGKSRAPGRLVRPTRETGTTKGKPAPVNIRVAAQSQRLHQGPSQSSFSQSQYESAAPPPPPKTGLRTNSAQSNSRTSTMPASRVKALEAAARKKEQEEREKQRKADQKRELERKRTAKADDERRVEQERKAEEQRKLQEQKQAAQRQAEKQAAEARRREQQRLERDRQERERLEQQRQQEAAQKARAAHELAESIQRERAQQQALPRGDVGGTLRQLGQKTVPDLTSRVIPPNPAKPPKRNYQNEDDEHNYQQPQRPGVQRNPPSYQQNEAKRRKTEEDEEVKQRHSVMAPPKRPSAMRKETVTKFPHGYAHAPPPAPHHSSSIFKSTVTAQHQMQHKAPGHPNSTVQHSSARIPFAEPAASSYSYTQQPQDSSAPPTQSKFKTPARPAQVPKSAKSSPLYPNGDAINLPEIMTDSEDEDDSDNEQPTGFRAPSWVASPALRDLLTQQQLVDPETVFGPIGELQMDEVFKGAKNQDRLKRFRERGSSARWVETGDAVTSAEKRRDLEGRERLVKDGGWRYDPKI